LSEKQKHIKFFMKRRNSGYFVKGADGTEKIKRSTTSNGIEKEKKQKFGPTAWYEGKKKKIGRGLFWDWGCRGGEMFVGDLFKHVVKFGEKKIGGG